MSGADFDTACTFCKKPWCVDPPCCAQALEAHKRWKAAMEAEQRGLASGKLKPGKPGHPPRRVR